MANEAKATFFALLAIVLISAACGHSSTAILRTIHLLSEDCVEIAHIHRGQTAGVIERICNGADKAMDLQLDVQAKEKDGGVDARE